MQLLGPSPMSTPQVLPILVTTVPKASREGNIPSETSSLKIGQLDFRFVKSQSQLTLLTLRPIKAPKIWHVHDMA